MYIADHGHFMKLWKYPHPQIMKKRRRKKKITADAGFIERFASLNFFVWGSAYYFALYCHIVEAFGEMLNPNFMFQTEQRFQWAPKDFLTSN